LEWYSTCFGQFLYLSSWVFHCSHSSGICHTGLLTEFITMHGHLNVIFVKYIFFILDFGPAQMPTWIIEEQKTNLMSLAILFHFLCAQQVSDINISIIRSLRLFCWITTLVVLLLMMDILMSETCWAHKKWNKIGGDIKLVFYCSAITMIYGPINVRSTWIFNHVIILLKATHPENIYSVLFVRLYSKVFLLISCNIFAFILIL